ncbi:hypothetical protein NDU88_003789 [Pleurodeles waltl]|uniref:Uncharacterized protein n=1 Tax=Pleurodeles waltl TaxID=8319 RepID=A0AAV7V1M6_PLEWA|nr:hypothetical protein NDU88_003789 [Pleurodeles waltl]
MALTRLANISPYTSEGVFNEYRSWHQAYQACQYVWTKRFCRGISKEFCNIRRVWLNFIAEPGCVGKVLWVAGAKSKYPGNEGTVSPRQMAPDTPGANNHNA